MQPFDGVDPRREHGALLVQHDDAVLVAPVGVTRVRALCGFDVVHLALGMRVLAQRRTAVEVLDARLPRRGGDVDGFLAAVVVHAHDIDDLAAHGDGDRHLFDDDTLAHLDAPGLGALDTRDETLLVQDDARFVGAHAIATHSGSLLTRVLLVGLGVEGTLVRAVLRHLQTPSWGERGTPLRP